MTADLKEQFIALKTDKDGVYTVRIANQKGQIIFSETMMSLNKQIVLKGFSLDQHTITISPIK